MFCNYCGGHYKSGLSVKWVSDRDRKTFCYKCWPEVLDNMKSLPWYKGYESTPVKEDEKA